jgi:methionyl aminopeptidase
MITVKSPEEIKILREGGRRLALVLYEVAERVKPGLATIGLDELAEKLIKKAGGEPSFKNYKGPGDKIPFPASLCISINDEIVHGIPSKDRILKEGDIVSLDLGMKYKNLYTDMAITVPVGQINNQAKKLIKVAEKSLGEGIKVIKEGNYIGDIGFSIQSYVEKKGFNVVRKLVGHGVGYKAHEEPEIPNFGEKGTREILKSGMVLALESMITVGSPDIVLDSDNWTWKTKDGSLTAHFEHTVAVTKTGADVLTTDILHFWQPKEFIRR